ncbi:MAG: hypothetical protein Q7S83_03915 [bacterium]|nr:hypothetical protein [bacterium]
MSKSDVRRLSGLKIFRFVFPTMSNGLYDFKIESLDFTAKNKKQAKKDAIAYLKTRICEP